MKKKLLMLLVTAALALVALPMAAFADGEVAAIGDQKYPTLQAAVNDAPNNNTPTTITLIASTNENVTVPADKNIVLDLAGYTLNGGTTAEQAALTNAGTMTIKDSAGSGTIKRSDNGPSGAYYTIVNNGTMTFEGGNVRNNSGSPNTWSGASLICNGLSSNATMTIKNGSFGQDYFIAIKNEEKGTLNIEGGEITSKTQAVQNWENAYTSGGKLTGDVTTCTYMATDATTTITGGTINGDVIANQVDYKGTAATYKPSVAISGTPVVTGAVLAGKVVTDGALDVPAVETPTAADIVVTGGTFSQKIPDYAWGSGMAPTLNPDTGKYTVSALYVAQVEGQNYTDLASALTALATAENKTLVLSPSHPDVPIEVGAPLVINVEGAIVKGGILQPSANFTRNDQDGSVITVTANNVTLDGVTVDAGAVDKDAVKYAVQFYNVNGGKVSGGTIRNDGWAGILLNGSTATVTGTAFDLSGSCYAAIELGKGSGVTTDPNLTLAGTVSFANSNTNTADANRLIWVDLDPANDNESIPAGMVTANNLTVKTSAGDMTYDANGLLVTKPAPQPESPDEPSAPAATPAPAPVLDSTPKTGAVSLVALPLAALALTGVGVALRKRR